MTPHLHHDAQVLDVVLLRLDQLVEDKPDRNKKWNQLRKRHRCPSGLKETTRSEEQTRSSSLWFLVEPFLKGSSATLSEGSTKTLTSMIDYSIFSLYSSICQGFHLEPIQGVLPKTFTLFRGFHLKPTLEDLPRTLTLFRGFYLEPTRGVLPRTLTLFQGLHLEPTLEDLPRSITLFQGFHLEPTLEDPPRRSSRTLQMCSTKNCFYIPNTSSRTQPCFFIMFLKGWARCGAAYTTHNDFGSQQCYIFFLRGGGGGLRRSVHNHAFNNP